jgi:hypothetical protein
MMAKKVYACTVNNFWRGRRWDEGAYTEPLEPDVEIPCAKDTDGKDNSYFEEVTDPNILRELQLQYDPEDDKDTFSAYTEMIVGRKYTGEGMMATDDYHNMPWAQLRSYASKRGVDVNSLKREEIIDMLEEQEK